MILLKKKLVCILIILSLLPIGIGNDAAKVYAATNEKEKSSEYLSTVVKYLNMDKNKTITYDFNIKKSAMKPGASYYWYVKKDKGNPKAVVINSKTGLATAKEAGTAYIRCRITNADGTIIRPEAKVIVRNNITQVNVSNIPDNQTMPAGTAMDFNSKIINTSAGKNVRSEGIVRWEIKNDTAGVGSISEDGEVFATQIGTFSVRAICFQSKEKYQHWLKDKEGNKEYITAASKWYKISVANDAGKAVVTNQDQLDKALSSDLFSQITVSTDKKLSFLIKESNYSNKTLIINAPKADISNYAVFHKVEIQAIKDNTWNEYAKGNQFLLSSAKIRVVVNGVAEVRDIIIDEASSTINLEVDGKVHKITLLEPSLLNLSGDEDLIPITIEETSEGSKIVSSVPILVEANSNSEYVFNPGSEGSSINKCDSSIVVKVVNNSKGTVIITTKNSKGERVMAGESTISNQSTLPQSTGGSGNSGQSSSTRITQPTPSPSTQPTPTAEPVPIPVLIESVKQVDLSTFRVEFDTALTVDDVRENISLYLVLADGKAKLTGMNEIKVVENSRNKCFEITMNDCFSPTYTYSVSYANNISKEFTAASVQVENVDSIDIITAKVIQNKSTDIRFNLRNRDGVIINQPEDMGNLNGRVTLECSNSLATINGLSIMNPTLGETTVKTIFHTNNYLSNGDEIILEDEKGITCEADTNDYATSVISWTLLDSDETIDYDNPNQSIYLGDDKRLYVKVEKADGSYTSSDMESNKFKFASSDTSILLIDNSGYLILRGGDGTVQVTVIYNNVTVSAINNMVDPSSVPSMLEVDKANITLSNTNNFTDEVPLTATLTDQRGDNLDYTSLRYEPIGDPVNVRAVGKKLYFSARNMTPGTYQYKVWVDDITNISKTITITVVAPTEGQITPSIYSLEINGKPTDNIDLKVSSDDITEYVSIKLYGLASNNVKLTEESFDASSKFTVKVESPDTEKYPEPYVITESSLSLITVSGTSIKELIKEATGNYRVYVYEEDNEGSLQLRNTAIFKVVDSQPKPRIFNISELTTIATNVGNLLKEIFEIKVGNTIITNNFDDNIGNFDYSSRHPLTSKILLRSARLYEVYLVGGIEYRLYHTVDFNTYITVPDDFQ